MKCIIFKGDTPTVARDINNFLEEHNETYFKIESVTQCEDSIVKGHIIVTIIYSI